MAVMLVEEWGEIPLQKEVARERLPHVMAYMGYRKVDEKTWRRRRDRCGSGWWSLPDACPSLLHWNFTEVETAEQRSDGRPLTRYTLAYRVRMPGQILAHTDAKALELEIDRILHLLVGGFDRNTSRDRAQLVRWTILANVLLSFFPALLMAAALWVTRPFLVQLPLLWGFFWILLLGGLIWGVGLFVASRFVVRLLNRYIPTRLSYRSMKRNDPALTPWLPMLEAPTVPPGKKRSA